MLFNILKYVRTRRSKLRLQEFNDLFTLACGLIRLKILLGGNNDTCSSSFFFFSFLFSFYYYYSSILVKGTIQ